MAKVIFSGSPGEAKLLSKQFLQGKLRRIYHGIYTDDLDEPLEEIVQKEWMFIVSHIVSQGILSFRTAFDLKPIPFEKKDAIVFMTSTYTKTIKLPGLIIKVLKGNYRDYIEPVSLTLSRSSEPRMLLENLSKVNLKAYHGIKTVAHEGVERYLTRVMRGRGEATLNRIRDDAKIVATDLNLNSEFKVLNQIISALLSTREDADILKTRYAKAIAKKEPYDEGRIRLFESLALYLKRCHFKKRSYEYNKTTYNYLSFFESYFPIILKGRGLRLMRLRILFLIKKIL